MTKVTSKYKLGRLARRIETGQATIAGVYDSAWIVDDPCGYGRVIVPIAARPTWFLLAGLPVVYQLCPRRCQNDER